jgi:Uma2 family endonuclease
VRAEFINGEVIVQTAARDNHTISIRSIGRILDLFVTTRKLGVVRTEQALTGFDRNDYAPDICFWENRKAATVNRETTVYPVPDLIAEILSASTERFDRGAKFEDYAANAVSEYWIVDPDEKSIEQYIERQGKYELRGKLIPGQNVQSIAIAGLEMPVNAAFDEEENLAMLRQILTK